MDYTIKINSEESFPVTVVNDSTIIVDGKSTELDIVSINDSTYHVICNNHSYNVEVCELNKSQKLVDLKINGVKYSVALKDKYDALLDTLGMKTAVADITKVVKAPMSGLVIDIMVKKGGSVKRGTPLVVLEAMKMENMLESPVEGIIKDISVEKNQTVPKNEILLTFE